MCWFKTSLIEKYFLHYFYYKLVNKTYLIINTSSTQIEMALQDSQAFILILHSVAYCIQD